MLNRIRSAALAALAAALALAAGPALAAPSLWVVKSRTSTVYLFGTVHLLNPAHDWRTPVLDRALHDADEFWSEFPMPVATKGSATVFTPEGASSMAQLINAQGTTTEGPPLTSRLSPAEAAQLVALLPMPQERLDRMRPWMAYALVSVSYAQKIGLTATSGADYILTQEAAAQGKPVKGLETFEQQLHFFADLKPDEEMDFLRSALADTEGGGARFEAMERAWRAGDDAAVERLVLDRVRARTPLFYRRFDVERNQRWIPQIEAMLKTPGVRFIAVGDGHFLGPDGVPALLRKDGWRVERVQ
jgi:uncharacterized protein YbaP (TraB family)